MTHYRTCKHCLREKGDCSVRDGIRSKIKGIGLTSVKFKCNERVELFIPGQRVTVGFPVYYDGEGNLECWPATVINKTDKGFLIRVDEVESDHETPFAEFFQTGPYCNVNPSRLDPLDEPSRLICLACGNPAKADGSGNDCWKQVDNYCGNLCLNDQVSNAA